MNWKYGHTKLRWTQPNSRNARKTHCPKGHEYSVENTRITVNWNGGINRVCRECHKQFCRDYRYKVKLREAGLSPECAS